MPLMRSAMLTRIAYANDSFHTLTLPGQIGLITLSLILTAAIMLVAWRIMIRFLVLQRLGIAIGLFYLFVWLSAQIYYGYYFFLFDNLPLQIVIKTPPAPGQLVELLIFQGPATLAAHSLAFLGWALIAAVIIVPKP